MTEKDRSNYYNGICRDKSVVDGKGDLSLCSSAVGMADDKLRANDQLGGKSDKHISSRLLSNMTKCAMENFSKLLLEATGCSSTSEVNREYASVQTIVDVCMKNLDCKTLASSEKPLDKNSSYALFSRSHVLDVEVAPIHMLPNETLACIFSFLDLKERIRTELVCKRWRWIGKHLPWTSPTNLAFQHYLKFDHSLRYQNGHIIHSILSRCGSNLTKVELSCDDVAPKEAMETTARMMKFTGDYCHNLLEIKLVGFTQFASPYIPHLAKRCPLLKSINLDDYENLSDTDVYHFTKRCQALECLDVSDCSAIRGDCFKVVGKNLKILRLGSCSSLESIGLESVMARCSSIQELRLLFCSKLPQALLLKVFYYYKDKLKVLHLDGYVAEKPKQPISWGGLRFLTKLEELSLTVCDGVDDDLLQCVSKKCINLQLLSVGGSLVTDRGLVHLAALPNLKVLNISSTKYITGDGMQALAAQGHLEEVYAVHNAMVSPDESCSHFAWFCPNFRILDVQGTKKISNALVDAFSTALKKNVLKTRILLVVGGTSVTDDVELCDGLEMVSGDMQEWESTGSDDGSDSDDGSSYRCDKNGYDKFGFYNYDFENVYDQLE